MQKIITTSWDDGHELDFRLADLLAKYNLKATFYIPRTNSERPVMSPSQVQTLSQQFEIGGHTLHHIRLTSNTKKIFDEEIGGSYKWLSDVTGKKPVSFCFPGGVYTREGLAAVYRHGYKTARTTALHQTQLTPHAKLLATTVQAYEHRLLTHIKHLVKRQQWKSLLRWLSRGPVTSLQQLTETYLQRIEKTGGCFHLWGHSWEIEDYKLWAKLEEVFKALSNREGFLYVSNGELATAQP